MVPAVELRGQIIDRICEKHGFGIARPQPTRPEAVAGFHPMTCARGFEATTVPAALMRAHSVIAPLTSFSLSFERVIEPFAISLFGDGAVADLPGPNAIRREAEAAYEVPPSAMNNAREAIAFDLRWLRNFVIASLFRWSRVRAGSRAQYPLGSESWLFGGG